jgi:hypothetical protein
LKNRHDVKSKCSESFIQEVRADFAQLQQEILGLNHDAAMTLGNAADALKIEQRAPNEFVIFLRVADKTPGAIGSKVEL